MSDGLPRVGSALLVRDESDRVLLGKRNKDPQRGSWVIPGGKIRPFESIGAAAARELLEETGLKVEVQSQFRVYEIINPPNEHRLVIYSWGKLVGGAPKASDDLSELAFFAPEELASVQTSPLVRQVLADAGLVRKNLPQPTQASQMKLFVLPVLLRGAKADSSDRLRRSKPQGSRKHKRHRRENSRLPFDD